MRNVSVLMGLIILRGLIGAEYQMTIAVATSLGVNQWTLSNFWFNILSPRLES